MDTHQTAAQTAATPFLVATACFEGLVQAIPHAISQNPAIQAELSRLADLINSRLRHVAQDHPAFFDDSGALEEPTLSSTLAQLELAHELFQKLLAPR